jgi:hypothetical protein
MTVSSVSLGHTATNPRVGDDESLLTFSDLGAPEHVPDGLTHEIKGIANRLTFESRLCTRELRILSERIVVFIYLTTQTTSSTP